MWLIKFTASKYQGNKVGRPRGNQNRKGRGTQSFPETDPGIPAIGIKGYQYYEDCE